MNTRTLAVARETTFQHLRSAVLMTIVLTVLFGIAYPLVMTGVSQVLFPYQANGSLVRDSSGNVIGSASLGQNFSDPKYFHPRPSAAGSDGYDATSSGGSNLGPTNQKLLDQVQDRIAAYREENELTLGKLFALPFRCQREWRLPNGETPEREPQPAEKLAE